jgi:DNA polymerase III delta subunit
MDATMFYKEAEQGNLHTQYLLMGSEPLLIEKMVEKIKEQLHVNEAFDYDTVFAPDTTLDEVLAKYYSSPLASSKRLIVLKNIDELDAATLSQYANTFNDAPSQNCLVMTYRLDKNKRFKTTCKKLSSLFKKALCVNHQSDRRSVHNWIESKIKRDRLNISPAMARYLEEEFKNDITGLKNEFDKIENYLSEAQSLDAGTMQALAQGLSDISKYYVVDNFLKGQDDTLVHLENLKPSLRSYAEIVYALVRGLMSYAERRYRPSNFSKTTLNTLFGEIVTIDRRVKMGTQFAHLMLELFFLKNAHLFRKGALHG